MRTFYEFDEDPGEIGEEFDPTLWCVRQFDAPSWEVAVKMTCAYAECGELMDDEPRICFLYDEHDLRRYTFTAIVDIRVTEG